MKRAALPADWRSRMSAAPPADIADAAPSPERRSQARRDGGKIERVQGREFDKRGMPVKAFTDSNGNVGSPYRVVDTLEMMHRRGTITVEMRDAGIAFRETFAVAGLDALRAADMSRIGGGGTQNQSLGAKIEKARNRVWRDITSAGGIASPGGSCLWYVLGWSYSLAEWATTQGWAGRFVTPKAASGILITALGVLVKKQT